MPPFSAKNPKYIPSRGQFLLHKAAIFLICYTILDLATSGPPQPDVNAKNFSARKVPLFSRLSTVSGEDLIIRLATTVGLWVSLYCVIQVGTSLHAFICVALNIDEPKDWRPSFGSLKEAYSVCRFWSFFWHQFQRQKLTGPAGFLVFDLLRLPRGSLKARYTHLMIVFAISGLQHALIDMAEGYSWQSSGSVQFFLTQAVGIMIEDAVQAIYSRQLSIGYGKQFIQAVAGHIPTSQNRFHPTAHAEQIGLDDSALRRGLQNGDGKQREQEKEIAELQSEGPHSGLQDGWREWRDWILGREEESGVGEGIDTA
ncbi:MAG: hypothetical protein Q9187_002866 [Circinaria calcarea]